MDKKRRKKDHETEILLTPTTPNTPVGSPYALPSRPLIPTTPSSDHTNEDHDSEFDPDTDPSEMDHTNEDHDSEYSPGHTQNSDLEMPLPDPVHTPRRMGTRSRPLTPPGNITPTSIPSPTLQSEDEEVSAMQLVSCHYVEDDDDDHTPYPEQQSADEEVQRGYRAPPPPKRLLLTYGDFTVEYDVPPQYDRAIFKVMIKHEDEDAEYFEEVDAIGPRPDLHLLPSAQPASPPPPPEDDEPFHLPKRGTMLRGIFDSIKTHLKWGSKVGETDANMSDSPEFLALMESLPDNGDTQFGRGGPTPTLIKKGTSPMQVKWQGGTMMYKEMEMPFNWKGGHQKCKSCWSKSTDRRAGYCREHSSKTQEVVLLRDVSNTQEPTIIVFHPQFRMTLHTEESINVKLKDVAKSGKFPTLANYYRERLARSLRPQFVMDKRWNFGTVLSDSEFCTFAISTSIMTFLHNNAFPNSTLPKIRLKMSLIQYEEVRSWSAVKEILTKNGFKFIVTQTNDPLPSSVMFPAQAVNNKPHTYQGHDEVGKIYDGTTISKTHAHQSGASGGHARVINRPLASHLDNVVTLYQEILEDEEETETRTFQAEFMGIMATIMGTILQKSYKGKVIRPMTKRLEHYDLVFDYTIFTRLFTFKTGCEIVVLREGNGIPIVNGKPQFVF